MLFKVRHDSGDDFISGSWINKDGSKKQLDATDIELEETAYSTIKGKKIPTKWKITFLGKKHLTVDAEALNTHS